MPNNIAPTQRPTPRWPILLAAAVAVAAWGIETTLTQVNQANAPMSAVAKASYPTSGNHPSP